MKFSIKKLNDNAKAPFRATPGSAGADLFACIDDDIVIRPNERILIPTGIAVEISSETVGGFIFPRSSVSFKSGVSLANCVGVIDSDYRGEIKVALINHSESDFIVHNGDRIAQLVFLPVIIPELVVSDTLNETERGEGGFGSTGV